jgi:D-xylose transport system permease protein
MSETTEKKISTSALRAYVMIFVLGLIWLFFHWATGYIFLTSRNLSNLTTQMAVTAILAVGMLMVIVSGNIDLSVGSVLGFAGGLAAYSMTNLESGLSVSILLAIVVGVVVGLFHGVLTAYLNIPAFIVTLGGLLAWRGATKWLLGGNTIPVSSEVFKSIGQGNLPPTYGWILAAIAILFVLFMAYRNAASVKQYGLGEANYGAETLKALLPIGGIVAFILVI